MTKEEIIEMAEKCGIKLITDEDGHIGFLPRKIYDFAKLIAEKSKKEQDEPVAWFRKENGENIYYATKAWDDCLPLYTTTQPKQEQGEPYGYFRYDIRLDAWVQSRDNNKGVAFYTKPQTKEWVSLTNEQIVDLVIKNAGFPTKLAKAIEAKLKEKNT